MALSALDEKEKRPTARILSETLGRAEGLWDDLKGYCGAAFAPLTEKWHFPGAKYGWSLQLKRKERTVLSMTPRTGYFLASVVLGKLAAIKMAT